jgi:hypothetical protein
VSYPQIIDYNEAVQSPRISFTDPDLRAGSVAETALGLPLALSGGFALTYTVQSGTKKYAVRCFHREVPEAQARYAAISKKLGTLPARHFVRFDFQSSGIRIRGKTYPIVKMDWADGETLGVHLERVTSNAASVKALRQDFGELSYFLERNGIAHGDIQNENVMVGSGGLRLIDYDGMYVSGMEEGKGSEIGQRNFQHPERTTRQFGPLMDRFSFIVMDVSLEAIAADSSLHRRFREGSARVVTLLYSRRMILLTRRHLTCFVSFVVCRHFNKAPRSLPLYARYRFLRCQVSWISLLAGAYQTQSWDERPMHPDLARLPPISQPIQFLTRRTLRRSCVVLAIRLSLLGKLLQYSRALVAVVEVAEGRSFLSISEFGIRKA